MARSGADKGRSNPSGPTPFSTIQWLACLVIVSLLAFPACTPHKPAPMAAIVDAPLEETEWVLIELAGKPVQALPEFSPPTLRLDADSRRMTGFTGCNVMNGPFTRTDTLLSFGLLATTRMACSPEIAEREINFTTALLQVQNWSMESGHLILSNSQGERLLRFKQKTL